MGAKTIASTALHVLAISIMTWASMNLETAFLFYSTKPQKGGHFKFCTIQQLLVSWLTMVVSLACDLFPGSMYLKGTKRVVFMLALPLSVLVSSLWWPLMFLYPSLALPPVPEPSNGLAYIPLSLDLALHAVPLLTHLVDFFLFEKSYGLHAVNIIAPLMNTAFCVWYASWVEYLSVYNGNFPYPFLTSSPLPLRVVIYISATANAYLSFRGINSLHVRIKRGESRGVKEKAS